MSDELKKAIEQLVLEAMASGAAHFAANAHLFDPSAPLTEAFGEWPTTFLRIRSDLVDDVVQAVSA